MKFGVCLWTLPVKIEEAIPLLKAVGYDVCAMEFDDRSGMPAYMDADRSLYVKRILEENDITVASLGINELCHFGMCRKEDESKVCEILDYALDAAVFFQTPVLQLPSFVKGNIHTQEELDQTIKCLIYISRKAAHFKITVGHESNLTIEQNQYVQKKVGATNLALYYDATNLIMSKTEDPIKMIDFLHDKICQVHVKDRTISGEFKNSGEGIGKIREVCEKLTSYGYADMILSESDYSKCGDYKTALAVDLKNLKNFTKK